MTVTDIVDGIILKKNAIGMTNQQLSDASGVPKTTIDRILRRDTPNPTMQTVLDLAAAVGFSFSNHPEQPSPVPDESKVKDPMTLHMISYYERQAVAYEERIKRVTSHFNMLLAEKNRWIRFSLALNIILIVFLIGFLILDLLSPGIGWMKSITVK
jgi:transcriptional regulator with XRE-family HTH domain